jgi:hypothetical protein
MRTPHDELLASHDDRDEEAGFAADNRPRICNCGAVCELERLLSPRSFAIVRTAAGRWRFCVK